MSQALKDLPDPLLPPPALPTSNPDDLLAKMADEAIDQLMADADRGTTPPAAPPVPMESVAPVADPPVAEPAPAEAAVAAQPHTGPAEAAVEESPHVETPPTPVDTTAESAQPVETAAAHAAPPPPADVKALLMENSESASPLLLPLRIINAPFAWLGDRARMVLGLLGIVTLVPAAAAIVYVVYLKH